MDEKDKRILSLLKQNSRMSNTEISRAVDLTEGAVRSRIKKLQSSGVITRFTVETAGHAANYAVVMAKAKGETKKMMGDISRLGIHHDAYEISGEYDGCIILSADSMESLDEKIDKIRKLGSVADTRTFISFRRW